MSIECKTLTFAQSIKAGIHVIPRHQRPYDWNKNHVKNLLEDIILCMEHGHSEHFLGVIMHLETDAEKDRYLINDGQQRIVTYSLLCAYLCHKFISVGDTQGEAAMLKILFCFGEDERVSLDASRDKFPRVKMLSTDNNAYTMLLRGENIRQGGKILAAWHEIEKFILGKPYDDIEWLKRFGDFILNKITVISAYVSPDMDATSVFETLNSRGKPLGQVHLLRNYIYSHFPENDPLGVEVEVALDKLMILLGSDIIEQYIHCLMQTRYGHLSSSGFYRDFKLHMIQKFASTSQKAKKEIYSLAIDMCRSEKIQVFQMLRNLSAVGASDLFSQLTKKARREDSPRKIEHYLKDLQPYSVTYPVTFAMLCSFLETPKDVRLAKFIYKSCKFLSSFIQRITHVTTSFSPSIYEKKLSVLACEIMNGKCRSADDFRGRLQSMDVEEIFSDKVYIDKLRRMSFNRNTAKARFLLARVVEFKGQDADDKTCTIEHILPQGERHLNGWGGFNADSHRENLHRLGNLTLLKQGEDDSGDQYNKNFSVKKKNFSKCGYNITKEISDNYDVWTPETIDKRQKEIAEYAAKIWNFNN